MTGPSEKVVRGYAELDEVDRYQNAGGEFVVYKHADDIVFVSEDGIVPVLILQLEEDGTMPESLVEQVADAIGQHVTTRLAEAIRGDAVPMSFAKRSTDTARAVLQSLLPSLLSVPKKGEE